MLCSSTIFLAILAVLPSRLQAFVVTGASGGVNSKTGSRPFRQDIVKMKSAGGPTWDLYCQALQLFQQQNQSDSLSWFRFNGVHGYPAIDWDGVPATSNPQSAGYAPHSSILFGPWHRVYLAAYEQLIQRYAKQVASQYPNNLRTRYLNAADTLRVPYWDWASTASMPDALTSPTQYIYTPKGYQTITNPLAKYVFHPIPGPDQFPADFELSHWPQTRRSPDNNGQDQIISINSALVAQGQSLKDRVYLLIARQGQYAPFSNTGFPAEKRNGSFDNLENIHNQIHGMVGGSGHMSYVPFSTFDPIFWLHHCNIDRLLAIWSAINPDSYVIPQTNDVGTYAEASGTVEDINTPLFPFHRNLKGDFHTPITARDMKSFAYSYPEVVDWGVSAQQLASNVRLVVKNLYNPTGVLDNTKRSMRITRRQGNGNRTMARDWFVNIKVNRTMTTPLSINFFMGEAPANPKEWATASNLVGSQMILPDMTLSRSAPPALAQIPLTRSLSDAGAAGQLNATDISSTQAFLAQQLQWKCLSATGDVVDPKSLDDLQISILDQTVEITRAADRFSLYGALNNHTNLSWSSN